MSDDGRSRMKWDDMSPRERDALVAREVMGREPEIIHIATNNGGDSACASTNPHGGPWRHEEALKDWLKRQQEAGMHLDYEMGTWERYPRYTTDIAAAWEVVEKMRLSLLQTDDGWLVFDPGPSGQISYPVVGVCDGIVDLDIIVGSPWAVASSAPEAICLAALRAKGVEV